MQERINNVTYILADLQGKAKSAEQEKESLITAMRLITEDSNHKLNATTNDNAEETGNQSKMLGMTIQVKHALVQQWASLILHCIASLD